MGFNPEAGPDYIAVYLGDILVFSRTLEEHRNYLKQVFKRIKGWVKIESQEMFICLSESGISRTCCYSSRAKAKSSSH